MNDDRGVSLILGFAGVPGGSEKGGELNSLILFRHRQFKEGLIL